MDADARSLRGDARGLLERLRRLDSSAHDGGTLRAPEIEEIHDDLVGLQRRLLATMGAGAAGSQVRDELRAVAGCLREAQGLVQRLLTELGEP